MTNTRKEEEVARAQYYNVQQSIAMKPFDDEREISNV